MQYFYEGTELKLTREAQVTGSSTDLHFSAPAKDVDGNDYSIRWDIIKDDFGASDDDSDACDWEKYTVIKY